MIYPFLESSILKIFHLVAEIYDTNGHVLSQPVGLQTAVNNHLYDLFSNMDIIFWKWAKYQNHLWFLDEHYLKQILQSIGPSSCYIIR